MKLTTILLLIGLLQVSASTYSQNVRVSVSLKDASLKDVINIIEQQTDYKFLYRNESLDEGNKISIKAKNESLVNILEKVLANTSNNFTILENNLVVITPGTKNNQQITIKGKVTSSTDNQPLPGVNVVIKGTSQGAVTDLDGNFSISVPNSNSVLVFSFVGFLTEEIEIAGQTTINITLVEDIQALEEVVVIGYGTVTKSDLTGSVSQVKADDIAAYPAISTTQAIQGRAAGVQVTSNNGEPGSTYKVRIRGGTSINSSSDPLFVIDGFPGGTMPPPEDIESIEILKDASATAIYGSRGANGVIMVTTKRGSTGKTKIEFNSSFSSQEEIKRLDLLDAQQFAELINEVTPGTYANPASIEGTDWQDEIYRKGGIQNYNLGISGGNENVNYYVSGTIYDQQGIIINSDYKRYSVTSNIDIKASDKLKIGASIYAQRRDKDGIKSQEGSGGTTGTGVLASAFQFAPTQSIFNEDGTYTISEFGDPKDNPVALANERINEEVVDRFQGNFYAELSIIEGLKFRTVWGGNIYNRREGTYLPTTLNGGANVGGDGTISTSKNTNLINENYLTFNKNIAGVHDITVMGGYSYQSTHNEDWTSRGQTYLTDAFSFWDLDGSSNYQRPSSGITETALASFYGRIFYKALDRYLLTINARYDGSSRFAKNNKWAFFPSGSFAWNIAEEPFMQNIDQLSQLKLRASYGVTGNQAIPAYRSLAKFGNVHSIFNGNIVNAVRPTEVANDNLSWESTSQTDIGIDIGLFNLRLLMTADYYQMETYDLLFEQPLPPYSGFDKQWANIGRTENKGFEFTLSSKNLVSEFEWDTDFNISANRNKILELPDDNDIYGNANPGHMVGTDATKILHVGEPVGVFWGFIYDGVYQEGDDFISGSGFEQEAGGEKYRDIDGITDEEGGLTGEPDGTLNNNDKSIIGNPHPDFIWGLNNTFRYKGFDLNIFLQGSQGNDIMSYTLMELDKISINSNATTEALNRWTPTNTNTDVPKAVASRGYKPSTRWIFDGSYIRLKNISLGYSLPQSLISKIGVKTCRIYVSGQNILTFTDYPGIDPEVNYRSSGTTDSNWNLGLDYGSYPNAKSYTIGFNIGF